MQNESPDENQPEHHPERPSAVLSVGTLTRRRLSWILVCAFAVTCLAAVIGTAEISYLFQPSLQAEARNYGAFISLPLAGVFLAYHGRRATLVPWTRPPVVATLACLALGQFGWHAVGIG
jgi:hypothetical protein